MACVATKGEEGERTFLAVSAVGFVASAAATIGMATTGMPICGGGTMMLRPSTAASFLGMWLMMMTAMMLPSLVPMLRRYRQAVGGTGAPIDRLTGLVAAGYFCAWTGVGLAVFALDAVLPPARPYAGAVVLIAGLLQFTAWKRRALAGCRERPGRLAGDADAAWRHGLHLGVHCVGSSAGLTAILLVVGMMDLAVMAAVTAAITAERLAPAGLRIARSIGVVLVGSGLLLLARGAVLIPLAAGLWI